MARSTFSANLVRHPERAAQDQARRRVLIAERRRAGEHRQADELVRTYLRIEQAFRDVGRCQHCGRVLTDPTSVNREIGPDCWRSMLDEAAEVMAVDLAVRGMGAIARSGYERMRLHNQGRR